ncbi:MAG TPA: hypothetical protein VFW87_03710, partial [Pirellulales bacterium]|nr:hypothetical protein [Pirellulales bacterium]
RHLVSLMGTFTAQILPRYDRRTWLVGIAVGLAAATPVVAGLYWFLRPAALVLDWPLDQRGASALKIDGRTITPPRKNPAYIRLRVGSHRVVLLRRGYEPIEWNVEARLGARIRRRVEWKPVTVSR